MTARPRTASRSPRRAETPASSAPRRVSRGAAASVRSTAPTLPPARSAGVTAGRDPSAGLRSPENPSEGPATGPAERRRCSRGPRGRSRRWRWTSRGLPRPVAPLEPTAPSRSLAVPRQPTRVDAGQGAIGLDAKCTHLAGERLPAVEKLTPARSGPRSAAVSRDISLAGSSWRLGAGRRGTSGWGAMTSTHLLGFPSGQTVLAQAANSTSPKRRLPGLVTRVLPQSPRSAAERQGPAGIGSDPIRAGVSSAARRR